MDMTEEGYWYLEGRDHKCRLTSYSAQDIHVSKMSIVPKSRNPVIKGMNGRKKDQRPHPTCTLWVSGRQCSSTCSISPCSLSNTYTRIPPFPSVLLLNPVLQTPAATVSLDSRLCLLTLGHVPDSLWLLFLCTPLGRELFRLEQLRGQLPGFLSLRDACPSLPDVQCLENHT